MAFYDKVKERIKNGGKDESDEADKRGGNVSFDQLIENAKQARDDKNDEPDDTQIEDLSGAQNKDYGDPSRIELKEDKPSQSQRQQNTQESQPSQQKRQAANQQQAQPQAGQHQQPDGTNQSRQVENQARTAPQADQSPAPQQTSQEQHRPQAGQSKKSRHEPQAGRHASQEPEQGKQSQPAEESTGNAVLGVLKEIRDQNREMIELLKQIERR